MLPCFACIHTVDRGTYLQSLTLRFDFDSEEVQYKIYSSLLLLVADPGFVKGVTKYFEANNQALLD